MATRAMTQLFTDTHWENIDYLIVDLPPGTGDIQLSLAQNIPLSGVVIVSTPQQVALADVRKGIGMFRMEGLQVPILGIIENMAYFTPAELPENKYYIFGKNGARALAEKDEIPFLGEIPLVQSICESGDAGHPVVLQGDTPQALAFKKIAGNVAQQLAIRNAAVNEPEKEKNTAS
jgi:ATP-binding protein involved in chromosome partitioning